LEKIDGAEIALGKDQFNPVERIACRLRRHQRPILGCQIREHVTMFVDVTAVTAPVIHGVEMVET